jgi:hypothetical protein
MTNLYGTQQNADVAIQQKRRIVIAEVQLLRKFEGKQLIEERIDREMSKLHKLWFRNRNWDNTGQPGISR